MMTKLLQESGTDRGVRTEPQSWGLEAGQARSRSSLSRTVALGGSPEAE